MTTTTDVLELDKDYIISKSFSILPQCGIYFLIDGDEIVYVGQSRRMNVRLTTHRMVKKFERVFFIECKEEELDALEKTYIWKFSPKLNKTHNFHITETPSHFDESHEITAAEFRIIEQEYQNALQARREGIVRQSEEGWTQQQIASYWGLDTSRINRIIKSHTVKGEIVPT